MRKYCILPEPVNDTQKLMLFENRQGVCLFVFNTVQDQPCANDYWFGTAAEAEWFIQAEYGSNLAWTPIDDPMDFCQDDLIHPVRVKGRNTGHPMLGRYEQLVDGQWKDIHLELP